MFHCATISFLLFFGLWLVSGATSSLPQLQPLRRKLCNPSSKETHLGTHGQPVPTSSHTSAASPWSTAPPIPAHFNVTLVDEEELIWTSPNDTQLVTVSFSAQPGPNRKIIDMERFSEALQNVNCSRNMMLQFQSRPTYEAALTSFLWVNGNPSRAFVLVGDPELCQTGNARDPWLVSHAEFSPATRTIHLTATEITWMEAAHNYTIEFGGLDKRLQTRRIPGFDKAGDAVFDLGTSWPSSILDHVINPDPLVQLKIDCNDCGTKGVLALHGRVKGNMFGVSVMDVSLTPRDVQAEVHLELALIGKKASELGGLLERDIPLWDKPLPMLGGFEIPKILRVGPRMIIGAGYGIDSIEGEAKLSTGVTARIPEDAIARADLAAADIRDKIVFRGWTPTFETEPLTAEANIAMTLKLWFQLSFNMSMMVFPDLQDLVIGGVKIPKQGFTLGVNFKVPVWQFESKFGTKTGGFCANDPRPFGLNLDLEIGASVGVDGWLEVLGVEKDLIDVDPVEKDDIAHTSTCVPLGSLPSSSSSSIPSGGASSSSQPPSPASSSSTLPRVFSSQPPGVPTPPASPVPADPTAVPPTRTCTSDCGWQWVVTGAAGWWSANSWSLPTPFFLNNAAGQRTLNTGCVQPGEVDEFAASVVRAGGQSIWEDWPLGSDTRESCCLEYFAGNNCQRTAGGVVAKCDNAEPGLEVREERTQFDVRSFRVYGCRGPWSGQS